MKKQPIRLRDIMFYGRCYPPEMLEKWYDKDTREIFYLSDLIDRGECAAEEKDDILPMLGFIRLFEVNIVEVEKRYIQSMNDRKLSKRFAAIQDESYNDAFMQFMGGNNLYDDWGLFERKALKQAAAAWCEQNHFLYVEE